MSKPMAPDPAIGIWKLNVAESSFELTPAFRSYVLKIQAWEDGYKARADVVDGQGNKSLAEIAYKFDGKDYLLKGSPLADTVTTMRIDQRTTGGIWKKDGKLVFTSKQFISHDGKTQTDIRTGEDAHGRTIADILVLEKQ